MGVVALWIGCGLALVQLTGRVTDWFVMTDELLYERLAISAAKTGSPLPVIHGTPVHSFDQLYPLLIAPFFRHGLVIDDLHKAHIFGAFLCSSVCIPTYLLTRRVSERRWAAFLAAFLAVSVPWILYSSFLLTEVAAYPVFAWALLGMQTALARPSARNDALVLLALALAFLTRTQFVVLVVVLPLSLVAFDLGRHRRLPSLRSHRILAAAYAVFAAVGLTLLVQGRLGSILGAYGTTVNGSLLPRQTGRSLLQHISTLALGLGIVPVVVGGAWLAANVLRAPRAPERHAFACVAVVASVLLAYEVTVYDLRLGVGLAVYDRYLFYLAPSFLIATLSAVTDTRRPRLALIGSAAVVAAGFALDDLPRFQWAQFSTLDPDAPVAGLYRPIVHLFGGLGAARAGLALLTLVVACLFAAGAHLLRPAHLTVAVGLVMLVALPLASWYDVHRLVGAKGWASRPLTGSSTGTSTFSWVDQTVGSGARVTEIPYHVSAKYLVDRRQWQDLEFWNKSIVRDAEYGLTGAYAYTGGSFPKLHLAFDPATGISRSSPTPYVVQSVTESRFQIAGNVQQVNPAGEMLIDATRPWRLAWATTGPYDDGWLKPGVPARIRVYASPGQEGPRVHSLNLQVWSAPDVPARAFVVTSNLRRYRGTATDTQTTFVNGVHVCVPAGRYAVVEVRAPGDSPIPGELSSTYAASQATRRGSIYLADTSVSDDVGGPCSLRSR